jgi:hypothetical protein
MCENCYIGITLSNISLSTIEVWARDNATSLKSGKWVRPGTRDPVSFDEIKNLSVRKGERFSFAICGEGDKGPNGSMNIIDSNGEATIVWDLPHGDRPAAKLEFKDASWDKWSISWDHVNPYNDLSNLEVRLKRK